MKIFPIVQSISKVWRRQRGTTLEGLLVVGHLNTLLNLRTLTSSPGVFHSMTKRGVLVIRKVSLYSQEVGKFRNVTRKVVAKTIAN